ncbi:MAG: hypothetical protein LBK22_03180 [Tannerella sp.]|nr:hypothetical protein [Tannerella sp.]
MAPFRHVVRREKGPCSRKACLSPLLLFERLPPGIISSSAGARRSRAPAFESFEHRRSKVSNASARTSRAPALDEIMPGGSRSKSSRGDR